MSVGRHVEIVGGGLAGLSLGLALRRHQVPVTIFEAGEYPRHRVCGEFIAGLDTATSHILGLAEFLSDALQHRSLAWFDRNRSAGVSTLPAAALGLSRHTLDHRLAQAFTKAGGTLRTHTRISTDEPSPGRVIAAGRRRENRSSWIGLKCHVAGLETRADLELHLGEHGYVGVCAIDSHRVNVCGLFRTRTNGGIDTSITPLEKYLRHCGLESLADRVTAATVDTPSATAVAALRFSRPPLRDPRFLIGDAFAMIPPFTGNGMAMAFQSAAVALAPLIAWSRNELSWSDALRHVRGKLRRRFGVRLVFADLLHRFVHTPHPQRWFLAANRAGAIPFGPFYRILH